MLTLLSHITTYGEATPMLGLGSDSNSFVYVDGDPINNTDPTGLTRKGLPRNPLELLPLESGGGPRFGGPSSGGRSPFTNKFGSKPGADAITMLADGNADFAEAVGLTMDGSGFGLGKRGQRFSMVVNDGVVEQLNVEAPGEFKVSSAEYMLEQL